jgi:hypothetical protein
VDEVDAVIERILKAVGGPVSFAYPENEGKKQGTLKDRAVLPLKVDSTDVQYWHTVDLIESSEKPALRRIRFGYFRKKKVLRWGAQQTLTATEEEWKTLLIHAARAKPWFKALLDGVMAELTEQAQAVPAGGISKKGKRPDGPKR